MTFMSILPWQLGLPHSAWRIYRFDAFIDARTALEQKDVVIMVAPYRDWETDRKSTRLNSSHSAKSRMPSSA